MYGTVQEQYHYYSCSMECLAFELIEQLAVTSLQKFELFHDALCSMFVTFKQRACKCLNLCSYHRFLDQLKCYRLDRT